MFYTVNHCILPFDRKQLCSAFFAERVVKIKAGGGVGGGGKEGADFYTYIRTTLQKTKNWPCQRRRHFTDKTTPRKRILQRFVFCAKLGLLLFKPGKD